MPIPAQRLTIRDGGLGIVEPSDNRFAYLGTAQRGPLNEVVAIGTPARAVDTYGEGPLAEAISYALEVAGGPVYAVRIASTVAGAAGAVTPTRVGTSTGTITVAGAAFDRYEAIVEIAKSGTLGDAEFIFSLDNGRTFSEPRVIPLGGTYAIPRTNLTLTFVPGAGPSFFQLGDRFAFASTAPYYSAVEMNAGLDAVAGYLSITPGLELDAVVLLGRHPTGSAAAVLFGALATRLSGFATTHRYMGAILDGGSGEGRAAVKTAFAAVSDNRILVTYGDAVIASSKGYAGFSAPLTSALVAVAARAQQALPSTDLARFADGSLPGVTAVSHDEFVTEEMDAAGFATLRTWPGAPGFYITNARIKSAPGSDFKYWQHRRLMDLACRTVVRAQQPFMSGGFDTNPDGTIEETDAKMSEAGVKSALRIALLDPKNAEGRRGHVSGVGYAIDRSNNIVSSETLRTTVGITPRGYVKQITTDVGFALGAGT